MLALVAGPGSGLASCLFLAVLGVRVTVAAQALPRASRPLKPAPSQRPRNRNVLILAGASRGLTNASYALTLRDSAPSNLGPPAPDRQASQADFPAPPDSGLVASCADWRPSPVEMSIQAALETLQAEVLRLSPADRTKLLDCLVASLDIDLDVEAAWDERADRREHDLETGAAKAIPLEVAVARLVARFPG